MTNLWKYFNCIGTFFASRNYSIKALTQKEAVYKVNVKSDNIYSEKVGESKTSGLTQWSSLSFTIALNIYKLEYKQSHTKIFSGLLCTCKFLRNRDPLFTFKLYHS